MRAIAGFVLEGGDDGEVRLVVLEVPDGVDEAPHHEGQAEPCAEGVVEELRGPCELVLGSPELEVEEAGQRHGHEALREGTHSAQAASTTALQVSNL